MRAKDDAADSGDGCFSYVQALLNEGGTEHEEGGEAAEDYIDQMRPVDGQVVPRHCVVGAVFMVMSDALLPTIWSRDVVRVSAQQLPAFSMFVQRVCMPLPIPQSVDSLKRMAWCRSIQTLVAPSRRSTPVENMLARESNVPLCVSWKDQKHLLVPENVRGFEVMSVLVMKEEMDGGGRYNY